ncbi:hypothetical protein ASF78_02215 [Cellulomonas sp. Leaf334]|nr:hypothetical protein ASF78_02215 [Cellulomonas sp. Leaf334]
MTSRGASVATRYDQRLCAHLDVRTEYGLRAARAGAGLVREAIVAARAQGLRTAELTLDVASPVTGAVLELLRDLVHDDVADLRVRRAGGTVLVEVELAAHPPVHDGDAPPARGGGRHLTELSRRLGAA